MTTELILASLRNGTHAIVDTVAALGDYLPNPVDTASNVAQAALDTVSNHPYTAVATGAVVVGGAYALHKYRNRPAQTKQQGTDDDQVNTPNKAKFA